MIFALFYYSNNKTDIETISSTQQHTVTNDHLTSVSYIKDVKPILDKRCVVCHSCYDAPCQLKLSSIEGATRGANEEKIYNPKRLKALPPSRLYIDAKTEKEWRSKNFHSVLDTTENTNNKSLLKMLLDLKQHNPQPASGKLSTDITLDIEREQICPTQDKFNDYAKKHPLWGMPYAMPGLDNNENTILNRWLSAGAPMPRPKKSNDIASNQVSLWEKFFNQNSNKHRLASRYIYEHLFHAHIHFAATPKNEFYRLVRSHTPPGITIDEIATTRPYDNPETATFYYRLLPYVPTIVAKNHIVYEFSKARLKRYQQLFIDPEYQVEKLPSYAPDISSNPFKVFAAIPPDSRYRFMLDDARFFIEGFVKGPVCRGQVALNVIEDQFWIVFFNPDQKIFTTQETFLDNMSDYLRIPSERKSHLNLLPMWTGYWQRQKQYMLSKQRYFEKMNTHDLDHAMNYIWAGNGKNPNAALTVLRHFDSASVEYGFVGDDPETLWIIDYPLFERIHYLLVAGFNIYGNIGHQLSTRIFMDFLRMEGEDHFLAFLPVEQRKKIRDTWYQGMRVELDTLFKAPMDWLKVKSVIGYKTNNPKFELLQHMKQRLAPLLIEASHLNLCGNTQCKDNDYSQLKIKNMQHNLDSTMRLLSDIKGEKLHDLPEVSLIRITTNNPELSFNYSLIRNKAYKNVTSLLSDEQERNPLDVKNDSLIVTNWLIGSYPNFFFTFHVDEVNQFIEHFTSINNQDSFDKFVQKFGVRRTSPAFWKTADWFQQQYKKQRPIHSGLYDLSRYSNL